MNDRNPSSYEQHLHESRQIWDSAAETFDNEPDHGLRHPVTLAAWTDLIRASLPARTARVLDIGCGTGSLSLVIAGLGHDVTGIDLSPEMIILAKAKAQAASHAITFHVMDAAYPELAPQQFDVIVCRHLLWTLPEIDQVLQRWIRLLKPDGRLLLIEGYWYTKAGLHAQDIVAAFPESVTVTSVQNLSDQGDLWGRVVEDERYIIIADLQS